ncbi:MAG TPA: hypothetical protein DE313_02445 [Ruminococcus sp.]|nr:hypothetical protein [Ruminococcus sp.]
MLRLSIRQAGAVLFISVQPFANVVGNYTSRNRENKRNYVMQLKHLLPAGKSRQLKNYITGKINIQL